MNPEKSTVQYVRIVYKTPKKLQLSHINMIIVQVKEGEQIERALKKFKRKFEKTVLNAFLKKDNRDYRKQVETAISILNNLEL